MARRLGHAVGWVTGSYFQQALGWAHSGSTRPGAIGLGKICGRRVSAVLGLRHWVSASSPALGPRAKLRAGFALGLISSHKYAVRMGASPFLEPPVSHL